MPRDPLAPVLQAAQDLNAAVAGKTTAAEEARATVAAARERERQARAELHRRMVEAARAGVAQLDIIRASGLTREAVRRILRAGGIGPAD